MKALVVYESMFGNTRAVAMAIADGLRQDADVTVLPVGDASEDLLGAMDLVVVGGPTHVHGMSRAATRKDAAKQADKPGSQVKLEPGADGPGVRDWLASLGQHGGSAAAFDTRMKGPAILTGRASKGIAGLLRQHGLTMAAKPASFLVTRNNVLVQGQENRARDWGARLGGRAAAAA
ncbi:MAG TPA: flavodoxin domain-containing protein [Streptosporangiaceae bacterium]|nr:flavodoxin domain-containing protein [Streptosporangiaceae bacterium]